MATKVLGTELYSEDLQYLLGLGDCAKQRRQVARLFNYQLNQIKKHRLSGIASCKQLHECWLKWLTTGARKEDICSMRFNHGHRALLKYAQWLYITYLERGQTDRARIWLRTVTTVLRSYQVCGPSKDDMQKAWKYGIRSRITEPMDPLAKKHLLAGLTGEEMVYGSGDQYELIYTVGRLVSSLFDRYEKTPVSERKGLAKSLSSLRFHISVDDYSQLLKAGPHKDGYDSIVSIFGEALDAHALSRVSVNEVQTNSSSASLNLLRLGEQDCRDDSRQVVVDYLDSDISLLELTDYFNEQIVYAYKHQQSSGSKDMSLVHARKIPVGTVPSGITCHPGRLVVLADKGGKTRVIAIAGYMVNNCLSPLHMELKRILDGIPHDCTDQNKAINVLKLATSQADAYLCSADLTAATDRLPAVLQAYILFRVFKLSGIPNASELAKAWYLLMTRLPYQDPCSNKRNYVTYGAGQGMGVYTSWFMLALTNHILIRACYMANGARLKHMCNGRGIPAYLVCGDDVFIGDQSPAELYMDCMNVLGVTINRAKSHITHSSDPIKVAEFCKKLYVNGQILSGESPKLLIRAARDEAYATAAIECIHSFAETRLSKRKVASLVGTRRLDKQQLYLPYRYGGWGLVNSNPLHTELLKDNFIFLYIYKLMRGQITAREHVLLRKQPDHKQASIDALFAYADDNPYRVDSRPDWYLMNKKAYTPVHELRSTLVEYESILTGRVTFPVDPWEFTLMVEETFSKLKESPIPINLKDKIDKVIMSKEALFYRRSFTRARRNLEKGKVHTFAYGVQPLDLSRGLDLDSLQDPSDSKLFVEELDRILFTR